MVELVRENGWNLVIVIHRRASVLADIEGFVEGNAVAGGGGDVDYANLGAVDGERGPTAQADAAAVVGEV